MAKTFEDIFQEHFPDKWDILPDANKSNLHDFYLAAQAAQRERVVKYLFEVSGQYRDENLLDDPGKEDAIATVLEIVARDIDRNAILADTGDEP